MKRNTALFGASLVAGVAAASGLIVTSTASSAASTYYGATFADPSAPLSSGWADGAYGDADTGSFWGTASAGKGTFQTVLGDQVSISVTCDGDAAVTTVTGGGAAGTYQEGQSVSLDKFINGGGNVIGTVTFGKVVAGHTAGAYIDMSDPFGPGTFAAVGGADCEAAPTSSSTTPSSSPSSSSSGTSSSTTNPPSSSTTNPPSSSTTAPPSSTTTNPPTTTPTEPPTTTPPPTTEPPTPTPTTTKLPVTG